MYRSNSQNVYRTADQLQAQQNKLRYTVQFLKDTLVVLMFYHILMGLLVKM